MTSPGDSGGGCAGEAASLIQVDGIMLVERRDAIDSFKQEGFFLEQFKQEGATLLLMDILMHWAFFRSLGLLHACTPTAGCSCSGPAVSLICC